MATTLAQVEAALRKAGGNRALAAKRLGITRTSMYERVSKYPRLQQAIADVEAEMVGQAVGNVQKLLEAEDPTTTRWFLERRGKDLGYGNSTAVRLGDDDITNDLRNADPETIAKYAGD